MSINDTQIRNAKPRAKAFKLTDGGGLFIEVRPSGKKLWRYRYRIAGKENLYALGEYPQKKNQPGVSLKEARTKRDEARELVRQGIHPARHRQMAQLASHGERANTFELVAQEWIAKKKPQWTINYAQQIERFLAANVYPDIGKLPIRAVTAAHLLTILRRVEERGAENVALLLRQWCSAIFCYAVSTLRADSDPAAALKGAIHRPPTQHKKPLSRAQIADLAKALDSYGGSRTTVIALRIMLLTFVRPGKELRQATWPEFNFERAEWRIPGARMKLKEEHIVPLSRQAVALLHELHDDTGHCPFLFPNHRHPESYMSATTLNRALEYMGFNGKDSIGFSAHGFRATASTLLNEMGFRSDVIERQLAHAERNKSRASYNQAEYLAERRAMMQQWADLTDEMAMSDTKVVAMRWNADAN